MLYYTLIGSRKTPQDIQDLMVSFVEKACAKGWIGRSGGADGADNALELGVEKYNSPCPMEVYLPWKDFNGRCSSLGGYYTLTYLNNKDNAEEIAKNTHPAWGRCSQGAKKLHTRNVYQILGLALNTPSEFILCWAEPKSTDRTSNEVKGGTATAVKLGIDNGAEIINLYYADQEERIRKWVGNNEHNS